MQKEKAPESPATLVAIIVAAHRVGDRELEREMRQQLEDEFGVKLRFARNTVSGKGGDGDD